MNIFVTTVFVSATLLVAEPATPASTCAPSDLRCTGDAYAKAARVAATDEERTRFALAAGRAYLGLFRETAKVGDLCRARQLIRQGLAQPGEHLRERLAKSATEIQAEMSRLGTTCRTPRRKSEATAPAPSTPDRDTEPLMTVVADRQAAPQPVPESTSAAPASNAPGASPPDGPPPPLPVSTAPVMRVPTAPSVADRLLGPRSPGRGLLVAGGLFMVPATLAGGLTAFAAIQLDRSTLAHNQLAAEAHSVGYTAPDVAAERRELAAEVDHWRRAVVGFSIATGVLTGAAVALIATGVAKRRTGRRLALSPALPGLLLNARF